MMLYNFYIEYFKLIKLESDQLEIDLMSKRNHIIFRKIKIFTIKYFCK